MDAPTDGDGSGRATGRHPIPLARIVDAVILLSVPAVLVAVATLPAGVRRSLAFEYARPTVRTAVTAPFVHLEAAHLIVNIVGYALVAPAGYLLSVASGHRRRFRVVFAALLLTCPPVLSLLNLAVVRDGVSVGFSGVLMALHGYLPLAIASHLQREFEIGSERTTAPLLFFLGLTLITVLTLTAVVSNPVTVAVSGVPVAVTDLLAVTLAGVTVALVLTVALYARSLETDLSAVTSRLRDTGRPWQFELTVLSTGVFFGLPFATFPADPTASGGVLNLYVHLLGYALGFTGAYTTVQLDARLPVSVTGP